VSKAWPKVKLGEVAKRVERPVAPVPGTTYRQIGVRLWGEGAYERDTIDGGQTRYNTLSKVEAADIIVNKIWARNGSVAVVQEELSGCYGSNEFPTFAPNTKRLHPRWFHWLTKTETFWEQCDEKSRGTSGKNRIRPERFLDIETPLPPLSEQQRIVARIEELATKIEEARGLRRQAAEEIDALISASLTNLIGQNYRWGSVNDVVSKQKGAVRNGPFGSQLLHEEFVGSGVAAIGTRDVLTNQFKLNSGWFVTEEKFLQFRRYQVHPGDILCTIVGGSIGRFCVAPKSIPLAFTTKHVQALTLDEDIADPSFTSYALNFHRRCRDSLFSKIEGSAQPSLNAQKILTTAFPLLNILEQRRIVNHLGDLQARVDDLTCHQGDTAAGIGALLPSVLDKAFNGEL
jgi:type I restriction enzyme, S subunit